MLPAAVKVPTAGSYSSTLRAKKLNPSYPPAMRTFPPLCKQIVAGVVLPELGSCCPSLQNPVQRCDAGRACGAGRASAGRARGTGRASARVVPLGAGRTCAGVDARGVKVTTSGVGRASAAPGPQRIAGGCTTRCRTCRRYHRVAAGASCGLARQPIATIWRSSVRRGLPYTCIAQHVPAEVHVFAPCWPEKHRQDDAGTGDNRWPSPVLAVAARLAASAPASARPATCSD